MRTSNKNRAEIKDKKAQKIGENQNPSECGLEEENDNYPTKPLTTA